MKIIYNIINKIRHIVSRINNLLLKLVEYLEKKEKEGEK